MSQQITSALASISLTLVNRDRSNAFEIKCFAESGPIRPVENQ